MPNENEIKAIFSLLKTEPAHKEKLLKSLADFYKKDPKYVYALAIQYYGTLPPDIVALFQQEENGIQEEIKKFLNFKNPDLLEGLILIARLINPKASREEILSIFNIAREDFDKLIDSSFEVSQKAQILQTFFFKTMNFEIVNLSKQISLLNLPEIFKNLKTTPFVMAVLYLVFIYPYEVKADIIEADNKIIVRIKDSFSLEPVYIDIMDKGSFVSESDCDMYAAGNFIKWDSKVLTPMTNRDIFKRLLSNLLYTTK